MYTAAVEVAAVKDTTRVYSSKAAKYAKHRWDYSPEAIRAMSDIAGLSMSSTVADVGAGTGIFSKHLAGRVGRIYAVEPNPEMRKIAEEYLDFPECVVLDGSAERTGLADHSVDLIVAAQAIHWFNPEPARQEFARVLKPAGWLATVRNYPADDDLSRATASLHRNLERVNLAPSGGLAHAGTLSLYFGAGGYERRTFPFSFKQDWEGFIGSLTSASYAPDEGDAGYAAFVDSAKHVFERFSLGGFLEVRGETELCIGKMPF